MKSVASAVLLSLLATGSADAKDMRTKVILNGKLVPVTFNDGDSFRVLGGAYNGAKARIAGYNTLESHGPVHRWGDWSLKELYVVAKMATMHARRGIWECTSDGKTDTYGRMLVHCPKLGEELIRLGMAHAMSIDDQPADATLLAAQRQAQAARRGFWSHGIPAFILTSLHSDEEDVEDRGTYNRLVSTDDGHSVKWKHEARYDECRLVCHDEYTVDESVLPAVAAALREDAAAGRIVRGLSDEALAEVVRQFARFRIVDRPVAEDDREALKTLLISWAAAGKFGQQESSPGSCMVHVPFERRYGTGRAACLK